MEAALMAGERLIVCTRYPQPGKTKTRLIGALGASGAAFLQRQMTKRILAVARALGKMRSVDLEVRFEGGSTQLMKHTFGRRARYVRQGSGDLGKRLERAFSTAFAEGARRVVIVGSDCPDVTETLLDEAFSALVANRLVIGPASDGGYYLVGLSTRVPELFAGPKWGTGDVCRATLEVAGGLGLAVHELETLDDVDRPEDVGVWTRAAGTPPVGRLSVIIPSLNEEGNVASAIESALAAGDVEVIVSDGGSTDNTCEKARSMGARVVQSEPPRYRQMNRGAERAKGDCLVFLHADSALPEEFDDHVRAALTTPGIAGGAFKFKIDKDTLGNRLTALSVNMRSTVLRMPYGDQGLFVRKSTFERVGGFPLIPIMEDFEFVRAVRRVGGILIVNAPVVTSGRRWDRMGTLRSAVVNQLIVAGHMMGVCPERLVSFYRGSGEPGK